MDEQKDDVMPSFDEGRRKPAPIESTTDDGPRRAAPTTPAETAHTRDHREDDGATATMPPEEAGNPNRHTM